MYRVCTTTNSSTGITITRRTVDWVGWVELGDFMLDISVSLWRLGCFVIIINGLDGVLLNTYLGWSYNVTDMRCFFFCYFVFLLLFRSPPVVLTEYCATTFLFCFFFFLFSIGCLILLKVLFGCLGLAMYRASEVRYKVYLGRAKHYSERPAHKCRRFCRLFPVK